MWYLVLSRWVGDRSEAGKYINDHLQFQYENHQAGNILFSGPSADGTTGIFVIRAASRQEAEAIADADPFHVHGLRAYEMLDWEVHQILGAGPFTAPAFGPLREDHPDRYPSMDALRL